VFGQSVAMAGDKVLIGAPYNDTGGPDAAYFFVDENLDPQPGSISGRIINIGDGTPISGVTLSTQAGLITTTDENGRYRFDNVPMGVHIITLSKTGYNFSPAQRLINIPSDATDVNFQGGLYYTRSPGE
jgi:hypothetical protein